MNVSELHIGLVGPLPPPSGGMANQTLQLAKLLREEGATVELIQVNRPYNPQWTGSIRGLRAIFRLLPYLSQLWQSSTKVQLFHVMANSGWSWHLFAAPAIWIAKIKGKPVIINYHGGEADNFFEKAFFWVKPSLDHTNAIIVPSGFLEKVFNKRGYTTHVVPNIIDLSRFSPVASTGGSLKQKDEINILVARNLEPIYDNATALRAFRLVKNVMLSVHLTIAGAGIEEEALKSLAIELDLADSVTFTGRVDNKDMPALYQNTDIMINPSLADNMPISILEALACGVPVVSTDVGGIPHLVEHDKTALLVPTKDPAAMADAILTLLNNPVRINQITKAGVESIQQYTWLKVRDRLLQTYQQVLKETNKSTAGIK